jgi:hypothetical protein
LAPSTTPNSIVATIPAFSMSESELMRQYLPLHSPSHPSPADHHRHPAAFVSGRQISDKRVRKIWFRKFFIRQRHFFFAKMLRIWRKFTNQMRKKSKKMGQFLYIKQKAKRGSIKQNIKYV